MKDKQLAFRLRMQFGLKAKLGSFCEEDAWGRLSGGQADGAGATASTGADAGAEDDDFGGFEAAAPVSNAAPAACDASVANCSSIRPLMA